MKQGQASSSSVGATKQEPVSRAVNVNAVAEIGIKEVHTRGSSTQLYEGRGLSAPAMKTTTYPKGSQK